MLTNRSAFILPLTLVAYPGPSQNMQPQIIREPPPNLTVPCTSLSLNPSPGIFHTHFFPSDPKQLILVLFNYITLFQSSTVQSLYASAKSILSLLCFLKREGHFCLVTAFIPVLVTIFTIPYNTLFSHPFLLFLKHSLVMTYFFSHDIIF